MSNSGLLRGFTRAPLSVVDESTVLTSSPTKLGFTGAGVTGSRSGTEATFDIPDVWGYAGPNVPDSVCSPCFGKITFTTASGNRMKMARVYITHTCYIATYVVEISTGISAGVVRCGVYAESSVGVPGSLVTNGGSGTGDASVAGQVYLNMSSGSRPQLVGGRFYYLAVATDKDGVVFTSGTPYVPGQALMRSDLFPNGESRKAVTYSSGVMPTAPTCIAATDGTQVQMPYIYASLTSVA